MARLLQNEAVKIAPFLLHLIQVRAEINILPAA
jgi:hypothetical protein